MEKLMLLQEEYIKFLEREVGDATIAAQQCGWVCPIKVYELGCKFRKEIEEHKHKYTAKNFEYKIEDYINRVVYSLDRFTPLSNGEMLEDTYGEYVLFSSVLNLFAAKK